MNRIHIFVLSSENAVLNQKTQNSLALIQHFPITITWMNDISVLVNMPITEEHSVIIPAGDHLTESYLDAFLTLPQTFNYAYQPQFSLLFANRGEIFYRCNIDISPIMEEINTLLLTPHHSRHIIFSTNHLKSIITDAPASKQNLFWHIAQYLAEHKITLITIADCISIGQDRTFLKNMI